LLPTNRGSRGASHRDASSQEKQTGRRRESDDEQASTALRNPVVRSKQDVLRDRVPELSELFENLGSELPLFSVEHPRDVLEEECLGHQALDDRQHLLS
jgi:hypothetical protein